MKWKVSDMDQKERAEKDIEKLERMLGIFKKEGLGGKYTQVLEYIENYYNDARHFYEKEKYFDAFGAANYAYGFIDCILVIEGRKSEENIL
jgi:hypothetical protein